MTFRDDIDAAYARLEVLEAENRKLVEEYSMLCRRPAPARLAVPDDHDTVLARIEELERDNPRLVEENAKLRAGAPPPPAPESTPKPWPANPSWGELGFSWDALAPKEPAPRMQQVHDLPAPLIVFVVVVLMLLGAALGH